MKKTFLENKNNYMANNKIDLVLCTDLKNILESIKTNDVWLLDWPNCPNVLTTYERRESEPNNGYVFQVGNVVRNKFNNVVSKISEIEVCVPQAWGDEKIEIYGQVYYRGLWTDMMYKNHLFRYFGNNTICLITENLESPKIKKENGGDTSANTNYFEVVNCLNESRNIDIQKLFHYLDCLITQAYPEESDKKCCDNCQNKICE